jgi:hypothetical protein
MQSQLFAYDAEASAEARDEALAQVQANPGIWDVLADKALIRVAKGRQEFIVTDVWKELVAVVGPFIAYTAENRRMGAVMVRGRRDGIIWATERYEKTDAVQQHRNPKMIWRSTLTGSK